MARTPRQSRNSAFTFVELLVALVVGAALLTAAVIGFAVVSQSSVRGGRFDVTLPGSTLQGFYGSAFTGSYVTMAANPNYAQGVEARRLKDRLASDIASASAVFCLGRNGQMPPALRSDALVVPAGADLRTNSTPEAFRDLLGNTSAQLATVFSGAQNGALAQTNTTIFVLGSLESPLASSNRLSVNALYELDFVPATSPSGTYASVRRYVGGSGIPTDYYHIFYPDENNAGAKGFRPAGVFFARAGTLGCDFPIATNRPFAFAWWPDPLMSTLANKNGVDAATSPRSFYDNMANRTSLFFVLPTFPAL